MGNPESPFYGRSQESSQAISGPDEVRMDSLRQTNGPPNPFALDERRDHHVAQVRARPQAMNEQACAANRYLQSRGIDDVVGRR